MKIEIKLIKIIHWGGRFGWSKGSIWIRRKHSKIDANGDLKTPNYKYLIGW